jgi:hypothetical protein
MLRLRAEGCKATCKRVTSYRYQVVFFVNDEPYIIHGGSAKQAWIAAEIRWRAIPQAERDKHTDTRPGEPRPGA